jgi:hypothetical protein
MSEIAATNPQQEVSPPVRVGSNGLGRIGRNYFVLAALAQPIENSPDTSRSGRRR